MDDGVEVVVRKGRSEGRMTRTGKQREKGGGGRTGVPYTKGQRQNGHSASFGMS